MSTAIPISPEQNLLSDDLYQTFWQTPLKEFVHHFEFLGAGILAGASQQQSHQIMHWAKPPSIHPLPLLETLIDRSQLSQVDVLQVISIAPPFSPSPYRLYGCLCTNTPDAFCYLLCWSLAPLTEHQRYGITLYARSVQQQYLDRPSDRSGQALTVQTVLQRTQHQLQTPLALILLYADLLKTTAGDGQALEWLENLCAAAANIDLSLNHLTDPLLLTPSGRDTYELQQLFAQCCQELQPWIEKKQLNVVYSSQPLWLDVSEWKFKQALQNLLNNAIAFSPTAGQITCAWQRFQHEVVIHVSDQGSGLSAEDLRLLGVPFYSRRPGGRGLGLAIAKQIILEHRGNLWAENRPEGGARFCIQLPLTRS